MSERQGGYYPATAMAFPQVLAGFVFCGVVLLFVFGGAFDPPSGNVISPATIQQMPEGKTRVHFLGHEYTGVRKGDSLDLSHCSDCSVCRSRRAEKE